MCRDGSRCLSGGREGAHDQRYGGTRIESAPAGGAREGVTAGVSCSALGAMSGSALVSRGGPMGVEWIERDETKRVRYSMHACR